MVDLIYKQSINCSVFDTVFDVLLFFKNFIRQILAKFEMKK